MIGETDSEEEDDDDDDDDDDAEFEDLVQSRSRNRSSIVHVMYAIVH